MAQQTPVIKQDYEIPPEITWHMNSARSELKFTDRITKAEVSNISEAIRNIDLSQLKLNSIGISDTSLG